MTKRKTSKELNDAYNDNLAKRKKKLINGEIDSSKYFSPKKTKKKIKKSKNKRKKADNFYNSDAWYRVRYEALKLHGRQCLCCGQKAPGVELHVDHIKPRSKYPHLELDINNLQILCKACNLGKSNRDSIDYRIKRPSIDEKLDLILLTSLPK